MHQNYLSQFDDTIKIDGFLTYDVENSTSPYWL